MIIGIDLGVVIGNKGWEGVFEELMFKLKLK